MEHMEGKIFKSKIRKIILFNIDSSDIYSVMGIDLERVNSECKNYTPCKFCKLSNNRDCLFSFFLIIFFLYRYFYNNIELNILKEYFR